MPLRSKRPLRRQVGTVLVALLFLVGLSGRVAVAEPPTRLDTYVVDQAKALEGDQPDRVRSAVDQLFADQQTRLWIVYVHDFGGLDPEQWAARTADQSRFGSRDLLLAVATQSTEYAFYGGLPEGVSDSELDDLLYKRVEPALREARWADAGIATADGLNTAMHDSGFGMGTLFVLAALVLLAIGGLVLFSRKRSRERSRAELAAARALDPDNSTALAALPLPALQARSREVLVEMDNAIRTSAEELELATGEFGAVATTPFTTALENAKTAAAEAFRIRQRLDDEIPETPEEQRALLVELIGVVGRADRELDARVAEFDQMRDLLIDAPNRLDALTRDLIDLTGRMPASEAELARLGAAHPAGVLASIRDNVAMAGERVAFAEQNVDAGRQAMALPVGQQGGAVAAIRAAEAAVGQARALLDGVDNAATNIQQARDGLPAVLDELRKDIAAADELAQFGGAELGAARAAAQQALAAATAAAQADPLDAYHDAVTADGDLDRAIAAATDRKLAAEDLRRRLDQALTDADARIGAAGDFVSTRRGGVGADARTRLSEARRNLDEARRAGVEPEQALTYARAAADLAGRALQEAQAEVRAFEASRPPSGGAQAGAVLGGILIDGLLRGASSGGGSGGYRAGSYGGSHGSRRVSRGGRF
ncbi:TPM domain-containing protein [Nocardia bovistercoris]|uniref:TPM domain-containing protein n=1 Tax=Nocardia bovistercoris TaxID=2785916 RepID=A0A931I9M0_9NOCA|nr:TPM domain-containing protein [Nocardia bovistercoris]MBH0777264.1 TPM domain-containing protein [Nocardia bovistercoris]